MKLKRDRKEIALLKLKTMFLSAKRCGSEEDNPEGVRYIQISDTLAKNMIRLINEAL